MPLRPEHVQPDHILAFYESCAREQNDKKNKERETVFEFLLDRNLASRADAFSRDAQHGRQWIQVRQAVYRAVSSLAAREGVAGARFEGAARRAGRSNNHDFDFRYRTSGDRSWVVKVELKKGESIHDQPQFLSLVSHRGNVTALDFESYPEFFYTHYIKRLAATTTEQPPVEVDYLALVAQPEYGRHPFFQSMCDDDKGARLGSGARKALVNESVAAYLDGVAEQADIAVAWDSMEERMASQLEKRFLSWSTERNEFIIESYERGDMTLSRSCHSDPPYLVLGTASGRSIRCMLRWRNHQAVLMPAWQISLARRG